MGKESGAEGRTKGPDVGWSEVGEEEGGLDFGDGFELVVWIDVSLFLGGGECRMEDVLGLVICNAS